MVKRLQIDDSIVKTLSIATIKNLVDGVVELVTNSDDSYKRIEESGNNVSGKIEIYVNREKGGICKKFIIKDYAEGMTGEELEKALIFAGKTKTGKSIRGLFGRGLKETIIALGEGEITTIKKHKLTKTRLWLDSATQFAQYDDESLLYSEDTDQDDGTTISIKITNDKIKIPTCEKFKEQLTSHFALRDINSSQSRNIILRFEELKNKLTDQKKIRFSNPEGKKVTTIEKKLPGFGDKVIITIYESNHALDPPRFNPFGLAGILIKTGGAILDNQLFRFENDPEARYFYGEAVCEELEDRLRKGETGILDPNRGGLEWKHDYSKSLSKIIEEVLEPLILKKKEELKDEDPKKEVKESTKKILRKLCNLLNGLAKEELEDVLDYPIIEPEPDITKLLIIPSLANIPENIPRTFTIYSPAEIVKNEGQEVQIMSDNINIRPLSSIVKLEKHNKYPEKLWYRYFKVVGSIEGTEGILTVNLGKETAFAKVKVAPLKKRKKGKLSGRKGGFISEVKPNNLSDPPQRVAYKNGIITVYVNFPSVSKFIKNNFENVEKPEARLLLAELVGEAFCRELARKGLESGDYTSVPGGEIDSFNIAVNELQKKYLHKIQEILFSWKFS
jgi:hypothetical protein